MSGAHLSIDEGKEEGKSKMKNRLTITDVANAIGVTTRTIMRWEKAGKIKRSKRDWRGWRFYYYEDLEEIKRFYETCYEYDGERGVMVEAAKRILVVLLPIAVALMGGSGFSFAETNGTAGPVEVNLAELPVAGTVDVPLSEEVKYTLGPNDVVEITVRNHPEFSGKYAINSEGKIEYKFVGDIIVTGLTKKELKERLSGMLAEFVIEPEVDVVIAAYLSKVFYVVGEVGRPGKFYMKGNMVKVREALIEAGLPMLTAAMRKTRLITPSELGENNYSTVDVFRLLYEGDLTQNTDMQPGDVLYVPSTVMAKVIRVISPVSGAVGQVTGAAGVGMGMVP